MGERADKLQEAVKDMGDWAERERSHAEPPKPEERWTLHVCPDCASPLCELRVKTGRCYTHGTVRIRPVEVVPVSVLTAERERAERANAAFYDAQTVREQVEAQLDEEMKRAEAAEAERDRLRSLLTALEDACSDGLLSGAAVPRIRHAASQARSALAALTDPAPREGNE